MKKPKNWAPGVPVFKCDVIKPKRRGGVETYEFWCPYCLKSHIHSAGDGHRTAHCGDESPMKTTGYILVGKDRRELIEIEELQEALSDVLVYSPDYMHGAPKKHYTKRLEKSVKDFPPELKPLTVVSADELAASWERGER